ncbi:MAG TPA: cupin domain-containing protein [Miltoncostaeaceae bacterium]|nr:cupin domain-containing protein [Miltoncostaeaceae bacterium]
MDAGVSVTRLEPGASERFVPLRRQLGVTAFGLNQMVLRPGERGRIHRHERQEEVYLVLEGTLTLEVEASEQDLARGTLARVGPEVRRRLINRGPEPCVVLAIGAAGEHAGRDGLAYSDWDDDDPRPPQEVPLPEDLPASELRSS